MNFRKLHHPVVRRLAGVARVARAFCVINALPAFAQAALPQDATPQQNFDVKLQSTYVWQRHAAFIGMRPWRGGELYFNPEIDSSQSLSDLHGLGALPNGENERGGGPDPTLTSARLFVRQTWGLGGGSEQLASAANQLAGTVDKRRVVLTAGKVAVTDIFDANAYAHDPRSQFLNWCLATQGAYDYAADARGYTWGAALEYYRDAWTYRIGRFEQPIESNGLPLDSRIFSHHAEFSLCARAGFRGLLQRQRRQGRLGRSGLPAAAQPGLQCRSQAGEPRRGASALRVLRPRRPPADRGIVVL